MTSVKVVVIGASGFLGQALTERLSVLDSLHVSTEEVLPISQVVVFDQDVSVFLNQRRFRQMTGWFIQQGDLRERTTIKQLISPVSDGQRLVVFLIAAVLSGATEANFNLGLEVNLCAPLALLEELKELGQRVGRPPTLVFTSSDYVACFNETNRAVPFSEEGFRLSPVSYGVQKACVELLICDFARRGFVDGRVGRVSTIIGRTLPINSMTGVFSSIFTKTLLGKDCQVSLPMTSRLSCSSVETNVESLLLLAGKVSGDALGHNRIVQLPARSLSLEEIWTATQEAAQRHGLHLGSVMSCDTSAASFKLVPEVDCRRAMDLGLPAAPDLETILENFVQKEILAKH